MKKLILLLGSPIVAFAEESVEPASSGFLQVVTGGGILGIILWSALALLSLLASALILDSFFSIRKKKIMPPSIIESLEKSSDALELACKQSPSPFANLIQAKLESSHSAESLAIALDLENEKMMQRINYLNVVGNLAPMLGLLGTVQGMILAFATLGTSAGAAKNALLAINISQALYTTAAGLLIAVPALGFFHTIRNRATKIMLEMEGALTKITEMSIK